MTVSVGAARCKPSAERLTGPRPVSARGVARLRLLLSDGAGPMYWPGGGDLGAELRAVLAQL